MITRWNPYREMITMRRAMDRLMEDAVNGEGEAPEWGLALDVVENEDAYLVKASVPGIKPEDIDITYDKGVLTIKGELKSEEEVTKGQYHLRERRYGSFARTVSLPTGIKAENIQADVNDGVLTLRLPKAEDIKPKRISVGGTNKAIDANTK